MPPRASSQARTRLGFGSKDCTSHDSRTIARRSSSEPISESARACRSTLPRAVASKGPASTVTGVLGEHRVAEIARMLGGERLSGTTLAHAKEMLSGAS